jgi:hypothetical protein
MLIENSMLDNFKMEAEDVDSQENLQRDPVGVAVRPRWMS